MDMDLQLGLQIIRKAELKSKEERIFQQWVVQLPFMGLADAFMPYDEYRARVTGQNVDLRPTAEIMAELDEVEAQFEERSVANGNI